MFCALFAPSSDLMHSTNSCCCLSVVVVVVVVVVDHCDGVCYSGGTDVHDRLMGMSAFR